MSKTWIVHGSGGQPKEISKRRSVEKDYPFYHSPAVVWSIIHRDRWKYRTRPEFYHTRDLAFMSSLYLTAGRVSELCRFKKEFPDHTATAPSIRKNQFYEESSFLCVRGLRIVKRQFKVIGGDRFPIESFEDYRTRKLLRIPLLGGLALFSACISNYLNLLKPKDELFKFRKSRGYQIVNHCTGGEFPHYLREMGLKMRLRAYGMNLGMLQDFSGHVRMTNLIRYLKEKETEEILQKMLKCTLADLE